MNLIGREHPAALLRAEIGRAAASHGGLVLVTGEAGIGKTTLVSSAAEEARELGALVLSGACWDSESAPGYWPWTQVARGIRRGIPREEWQALPPLLEGDDEFKLFDAVTTGLVALTELRPVVVVLDDLHWADPASLRLLEFVAKHTWFERLLLVGTYRDGEASAERLLPLEAKATMITLTGLGPAEVGELVNRTVGGSLAADLVAEVHRRTGGNPFFVEQTARLWRSGGSITAVAPGVRDAVRRRLSLLPGSVAGLLNDAAVLGAVFHRSVLAGLAGLPVAHVDRLLDEALAARLVVARGGGSFAFAHDLVRETLYASIDDLPVRHAAVIRTAYPAGAQLIPTELARHAYLAGDHLEAAQVTDLLLAAATDAARRFAYDEARLHLGRAYERSATLGQERRATIALDQGKALYGHDRDAAWRAFDEAIAIARSLDDPMLLARVALSINGIYHADPPQRDDLLREAHAALVGGEPPEPSQLTQELAVHLAIHARSGEDVDALVFGLWAHHDSIWGPGTAATRLALTEEVLTLVRRQGDLDTEHFAAALRWVALIELGDPAYLDAFRDYEEVGRRGRDAPRIRLSEAVDESIVHAFTGRFASAQLLLDEVVAEGDNPRFGYMCDHHQWALYLHQGRFDALPAVHASLREGRHPYVDMLEGLSALRRGDADLERLALVREPRERSVRPLWLRFQAELAAASGDPVLCERVRGWMAPHRSEWAVSMYGWDLSGPIALWLAELDAAQSRWGAAVELYREALRSSELMRARPWALESRIGLAAALTAVGEVAEAATQAAEARAEAEALGMTHLLTKLPPTPAVLRDDVEGNVFRQEGSVWTLTFAGQSVHLPDAKGLNDLRLLLTHPGDDVPAVQLLDPTGGEVVVAASRMGGDAVLDDEAKAAYRRRLRQLDDEIDRAVERADDERAASFDREREALLAELRSATGLDGRDRRLGDAAERARKTVTARIRDVLRKLDHLHPALAAHLRDSISTGATCRYQPPEETPWHF
ncbi:ATP-binding protein [Nonomuraea sp. NPDC050556]|uniref:ATP-binding protein n=1 Tax=Nonomuraea sp. NPDC050556 TaxID=3364369 RepID=UPI00379721ED